MDLTREEKIRLNMGKDSWSTYDAGGKISSIIVSDGPLGLRQHGLPSIAYPSTQMLSHTWSVELVASYAEAIADDCIERGVDVLLGPGITVKRVPTCGRNFEYVSEDPFLAGVMGYTYVTALQSRGVGACVKHYCCNNQENERFWISAEVDEKTLRTIYLKPFEIAVKAQPYMVMSSYNLVNGERVNESKKLHDILRKEFGFDGLIVSDWDAVRNPAAAINAGTNLIMPFSERLLLEALNGDEVDEAALDENNRKLLQTLAKIEADRPRRKVVRSAEERRAVAQAVEEEGIVLLKNNGVLPIQNKEKLIPVLGAPAEKYYRGGGSSQVTPTIPYEKIDEALRALGVNARYAGDKRVGAFRNCARLAAEADVALVAVGNPSSVEMEERDRDGIKLSLEEELYIRTLCKTKAKVVVLVYAGSAIDMSAWIEDVAAVVWVGYGGERVNAALARVLTGEVNPSGKLTETFPMRLEDIPAANAYRDAEKIEYSEGELVGYRYFTSAGKKPLFPFGYGLSYSTFAYEGLSLEETAEGVAATFTVRNLSQIRGKEISQAYVRRKGRTMLELKGFAKTELGGGESKRVRILLPKEELLGGCEVLVGGNSLDLPLTAEME